MAYVINDSCVSCGTCAGECPVNAISQGDGQYVIDADTCISYTLAVALDSCCTVTTHSVCRKEVSVTITTGSDNYGVGHL